MIGVDALAIDSNNNMIIGTPLGVYYRTLERQPQSYALRRK